jgi:hypothetical protein
VPDDQEQVLIAQIMFGFWGKSNHGNKGVNSAGLAL